MKFDLPQLAVQGSPKAMGQQQGEHWREDQSLSMFGGERSNLI